MRFSVLFSGSDGNCTLVETETTKILVDAGRTCKQICSAIAALGVAPEDLDAILITHDHGDHIKGLAVLEKKTGVNLYATDGTCDACESYFRGSCKTEVEWNWTTIEAGSEFDVGDIHVEAFPIPHDTSDPVGYVLESDGSRLAFATDLGEAPAVVRSHLHDCNAIILEFNHDVDMERNSTRPWSLIQRNLGRNGHLSNDSAAELLAEISSDCLHTVVPAHISHECNTPSLAVAAAESGLRMAKIPKGQVKIVGPESYPMPLTEV